MHPTPDVMAVETPRRIPVGDLTVAYTDSGEGEPLILVHGGESDRGQFDALRPFLGPGIRAISYDQRDTGDTVNSDEPYTIADLGADLAGLVESLGLDKAHVLGTSFGGMVAMHAALDHPERIQSVALVATTPNRSFTGPALDRMLELEPAARRAFMLDVLISPQGQAENPALVDRARSVLTPRSDEQNTRRNNAVAAHDCLDRLAGLQMPALVVQGTDDPLIRADAAEEMAKRIPDARLELINGGRHGIATEFPHLVAGIVREFVHTHPTLQ
ncbi:alpha/beta hydrolase [Acrocarpospora macrocephala]|uniref:Alpha/beta hydrolase n=2 Tax=Acrocarpospora macrocephala TaxID=150177 RepID=A0A5M3WUP7_9ACTN|nr:alpha/beta hydrolase [Acrocarpospora macrocephala]